VLPELRLLRLTALALSAAIVIIGATGIGRLQFNSHYSTYFDADNPQLIAHREIAARYGREDGVFIALQSPDSFLDEGRFRLLEDIGTQLAARWDAARIVSIAELPIEGDVETTAGHLLPSYAQLEDRDAIGLLLSEDERIAGIWLQPVLEDRGAKTVLDSLADMRAVVAEEIGDRPITAHYTGTLALSAAYIDVVRSDLSRILPVLLVIMMVVLGLALRSARAVLTMLPVGLLSVFAALGIAGLARAELAAINAFVPVIIMSISLAGCVHLALSFARHRDEGSSPADAALAALRYNLLPMSLANGSTALGFLGLTLSPSPPVRLVGVMVALGVVVSFLLCVTLLPALQARFDPWNSPRQFPGLRQLAVFTERRRVTIIALFLVIAVPAAWLVSRNVVSDNVLEYFAPSHTFRQDTQLVEERLSGINELVYSIDTLSPSGLFDEDAVLSIRAFAGWLRQQPEVRRVVSVADSRVMDEAIADGRLQERLDFFAQRIDAAADTPFRFDVSEDRSSAAVTVYLQSLDSAELIEFDERVHAQGASQLAALSIMSGGPTLMFAHLGEQNVRGMVVALSLALVGAAVLLGAVLRSARIAWIGLACNLLPVLLVYSLWAVLDGRISIGAAIVMGMILGIVIDDTIYMLAAYRGGHRQGLSDPVSDALNRVAPALCVTTLTLVLGLCTGLLSDFGPIWSMSALSVTIIAAALVTDLVLLPALLYAGAARRLAA
jgi:predicted RND superfamily exporter protein